MSDTDSERTPAAQIPDGRPLELNLKGFAPKAAAVVGFLALMILMFHQTLVWMWSRWFPVWKRSHLSLYDRIVEGESYYTHGPLVPLVSLLIVYLLIRYTRIKVRPRPVLGGAALALCVLIQFVSSYARIHFTSALAMIGVLVSLVLLFWGLDALKRLWFPLAFLLFMVPMPMDTMYKLAFRLKMFATEVGVSLANVIGPVVVNTGNQVLIEGGKRLTVANVCNGLRTMISLLAFGALYAYVCKLKGIWRVGIFLLTLPVALVANSLRIVSLILVAHWTNVEFATGWYHDISGLMVFVMAFFLMFGLERLILGLRAGLGKPAKIDPLFHGVRRDPDADAWQGQRMWQAAFMPRGVFAMALLAVAAGGSWYVGLAVVPETYRKDYAARALPNEMELGPDRLAAKVGRDMEMDERTRDVLETEDYLRRAYRVEGELPVYVTIIFSMDNRKGTHPPDVCLAGSGEGIVAKEDVVVEGIPGRDSVPFRGLVVKQTDGSMSYFIYTYKCGSRYTDSFWMQQLLIVWNGLSDRNASGALIRLSTPIVSTRAEARRRCEEYIRAVIPKLDKNLP
jgi:EpsI family protein